MKQINHANLARLRQLNEYLGRDISTPGFKPAAKKGEDGYMQHVPWENEADEKQLQALQQKGLSGLKSVHAGPLAKNYYQWDVTVKLPVTGDEERKTGEDRLWVYDENELWSTNMASTYKYKFKTPPDIIQDKRTLIKNNTIVIYKRKANINWSDPSDSDLGNIVGYVDGVNFYMNKFFLEGDVDRRPEWLKWVQTVGDFAGFIPFYGDIVDAANAIVYFIYDRYLDAFLSVIAVVPIVGSFAKMGAKGIGKLAKPLSNAVKRGLRLKSFEEPIELLVKNKVIDAKDLNKVVDYVGDALESLSKHRKTAAANGLDAAQLSKMDELFVILQNTVKDLKMAEKTGSAFKSSKVVVDAIRGTDAIKNASIWSKFIPKFRRVRTRLAKTGFWPESQIARIAANLNLNFLKNMGKNVDHLTALVRTTSPAAASKHYNLINTATKKYIKPTKVPIPKNLKGKQLKKYMNRAGKTTPAGLTSASNTKSIRTALDRLQQTMPPSEYEKLVKSLVKVGQEEGSLVWNMYKTSNVNNLKAYTSLENLGMTNMSLSKWVDIISNEVQNIAGDITGQPAEEQEKAVIWPVLQAMVSSLLPGVADTTKSIVNNPLIQTGVQSLSGTMKYAADAAGVSDSADYEVFDYGKYK